MVSLGEEIGSRGGEEEELGFEPLTVAMAACGCRRPWHFFLSLFERESTASRRRVAVSVAATKENLVEVKKKKN